MARFSVRSALSALGVAAVMTVGDRTDQRAVLLLQLRPRGRRGRGAGWRQPGPGDRGQRAGVLDDLAWRHLGLPAGHVDGLAARCRRGRPDPEPAPGHVAGRGDGSAAADGHRPGLPAGPRLFTAGYD